MVVEFSGMCLTLRTTRSALRGTRVLIYGTSTQHQVMDDFLDWTDIWIAVVDSPAPMTVSQAVRGQTKFPEPLTAPAMPEVTVRSPLPGRCRARRWTVTTEAVPSYGKPDTLGCSRSPSVALCHEGHGFPEAWVLK